MTLYERLFQRFEDKARHTTIEHLCLGLGYTAVCTSDGGIGIAYSYFESKNTCMMHHNYQDPEGEPAIGLVRKILADSPLERSMALAAINALNYDTARNLPAEPDNQVLLDQLGVGKGTRVVMVGAIKPLIHLIEKRGADLVLCDLGQQIGNQQSVYEKLSQWAQALVLTSTSLLNNTVEDILGHVSHETRTVLLGPSTPMVGEVFTSLPVHFLAGTVPVDRAATLRAIRHGTGTPVIQKAGRKVIMAIR
ncbi:MAG: DUF364 domain-containing protein [Thermodesulfobacteriota bacterium]